jgi:hypothetical protein
VRVARRREDFMGQSEQLLLDDAAGFGSQLAADLAKIPQAALAR